MSRDEILFAAQVVLVTQDLAGVALVELALALDLNVEWGELDSSLRRRCIWRARWQYRIRPMEPEPLALFPWWAQMVRELPPRWQPAARRFVAWISGRRD